MSRDLPPLRLADAPAPVRARLSLLLLDLVGIGFGGARTDLSRIIRDHAVTQFGGALVLPFDGRRASAAGVALATGMTIDALDGHDGHNLTKGHVGCGLFAGLLALAPERTEGAAFLDALLMGYEAGTRFGQALHASAADYHTSGAWIAPTVALAGARLRGTPLGVMRHAVGIAEYHGPRSPMMRCIDAPSMVKDGSGWGAMAGVSAVLLAEAGFTGAPALTFEAAEADALWGDLGQRWAVLEQYFKPYPVCRWAQAPVEAALSLRRAHGLEAGDIASITVASFHESGRLATCDPQTTEEAQYSTAFPVAVALARGALGPADIDGAALQDPEVRRLAAALRFVEDDAANAAFPATRLARVTLGLADGRVLTSDWHQPRWDATAPPEDHEIEEKFLGLVAPLIGHDKAVRLRDAILGLDRLSLMALTDQLQFPRA